MPRNPDSLVSDPNLSAGQLLDGLKRQLIASDAINGGVSGGLIHSLEDSATGVHATGLIPYEPGQHEPSALDIGATYANKRPLADGHNDSQQPRTLHVVVEQSRRFEGSTGKHSLRGLARMAVALTSLAAESNATPLRTLLVGDGNQAEVSDGPADALWVMKQHDKLLTRPAATATDSDIARGLKSVVGEELNPDSDVCVVVSDFIDGAERDADGRLIGFDWEKRLGSLHHLLGDRLYAIQLTTPAHTGLPYARNYRAAASSLRADLGTYFAMQTEYAQRGQEKADRITAALSQIRHLTLPSTVAAPLIPMADFIFGRPAD